MAKLSVVTADGPPLNLAEALSELAEERFSAIEGLIALAEARSAARAARDWAESDRLRDEIAAAGWTVRDVADAPGYQLVPSI